MGITLSSKNKSIDLGYGGFGNLRKRVAILAGQDIGEHYAKLDKAPMFGEEIKKKYYEEYNKKIAEIDNKYKGKKSKILNFLYACDCEGKAPLGACKKIYEVIKDYDDDVLYGYAGRSDCAMFKDFKEIVKDCIDNKCAMSWY